MSLSLFIEPLAPDITDLTIMDTTVFMAWQRRTPLIPETYIITVQSNITSSHVTYTAIVEVPGTTTEVQFQHVVITNQKYQYCLTAVYAQQTSNSACGSMIARSNLTSSSSCQYVLVGGLLGSVIVLLVLLLLLALVYPRCRSSMKDKKYLSK